MAEVFRAESAGIENFKKTVAIKRVLPHLSQKRKFIAMFLDEARLSGRLNHSNVVQVFDIGVGDNTYFIVMEYVDGADLKAVAEVQRKLHRDFPLEAAVYIAIKMCEGLAYAHDLVDSDGRPIGIVHRDLSPPNVLITRFGEIKVVDFGLAKANNQLEKSEPGIIKGKFSYLAPEAAMGKEVDARADIFAVGIILWELLAGRKLFQGESDFATVKLVQQADIPSLKQFNPHVQPELERIIRRALARDLNERYGRAVDLARDLNEFLFRFGRPVGPWDVAQLVGQAMAQKRRDKPAGASVIDQLIKDALFEFTSLRSGDQDSVAGSGSRSTPTGTPLPTNGSVHDWASEIVIKNPYQKGAVPNASSLESLQNLEVGNLSMLEDLPLHEPSSSATDSEPPEPDDEAAHAAPKAAVQQQPSQGAQPQPPAKKRVGMVMLIVLTLLVAAGTAGAWYANILPH